MINKNEADVSKKLIQLFSVDINDLLNLPCYVFWKSKQGIYLNYNNYGAINLGYNSGNEIINKTDLDIFPEDIANIYRKNDEQVITQKSSIFVQEKGLLRNKFPVVFLSYKIPVYDQHEDVSGILGLAFTWTPINKKDNRPLEEIKSTFEVANKFNFQPVSLQKFKCLSEREKMCMQLLCHGLTMKQIARKLQISFKTVETYIERIKEKMHCQNKAMLIVAFLKAYGDSMI